MSLLVTKSMNTKRFLQPNLFYKSFSKYEIQRYIDEIDFPNGELLIQVVQFLGPELKFHFQRSPWETLSTAVMTD